MGFGAVTAATGSGGVFQVGAKGGETIEVTIADMDTTALGVGSVNLETDASAAIALIDTAISTVSTTRGDLGAKQNRFESRIANLNVATENLSASESRIRDTDYAMEMVTFTRGQIMNQVGTSMLGQANGLPQGVLSLLRG
jgi:flagellin